MVNVQNCDSFTIMQLITIPLYAYSPLVIYLLQLITPCRGDLAA
jgi:hypothetical protein